MKIKTHLDRIADKRRRNLFTAEATREKLAKELFLKALEESSGAWSDRNHPELKTAKDLENYVREKRRTTGRSRSEQAIRN